MPTCDTQVGTILAGLVKVNQYDIRREPNSTRTIIATPNLMPGQGM